VQGWHPASDLVLGTGLREAHANLRRISKSGSAARGTWRIRRRRSAKSFGQVRLHRTISLPGAQCSGGSTMWNGKSSRPMRRRSPGPHSSRTRLQGTRAGHPRVPPATSGAEGVLRPRWLPGQLQFPDVALIQSHVGCEMPLLDVRANRPLGWITPSFRPAATASTTPLPHIPWLARRPAPCNGSCRRRPPRLISRRS